MPIQIPEYKDQAELKALPGVRVSTNADPNDFGAGVQQAQGLMGRQLQQSGDVVIANQIKMQEKQNLARVQDVTAQYLRETNTYMNDPEKGITAKKGMNANQELYDKSVKDLDAMTQKFAEGLDNDVQRQAFQKYVSGHNESMLTQVSRHVAQETKTYRETSYKSNIKALVDSAVANTTPEALKSSTDMITAATKAQYGDAYDSKFIDERVKDAVSTIHAQRVAKMMVDSPDQAEAYFNENKDAILEAQKAELAPKLKSYKDLAWTQSFGDQMASKYTKPDGTMDVGAALAEAKSLPPDKRQKAEQAIASKAQWMAKVKNDHDNDAANALVANFDSYATKEDFKKALVGSGLSAKDQFALLGHYTSYKNMEKRDTKPNMLMEIDRRIASGEISDSAQLIREYGDKVDYTILQKWVHTIEQSGKDLANAKVVADVARKNKIYDKPEEYSAYHDYVSAEINDFRAKEKRAPTMAEIEILSNQAMVKVVKGKKWFGLRDDTAPAYKAKPPDGEDYRVDWQSGRYYRINDGQVQWWDPSKE